MIEICRSVAEGKRDEMMEEKSIDRLMKLDLSESEARTYYALLMHSPLTGYAVSQKTGIARSQIYGILESLLRKGCVMVSKSSTPQYVAVPYRQFFSRYAARRNANRNLALEAVESHKAALDQQDVIWNLLEVGDIFDTLLRLINESRSYILLKLWAQDAEPLAPSLSDADGRGVELHVIVLGASETPAFPCYFYETPEEGQRVPQGRQIKGEFDGLSAFCGEIGDHESSFAAWTSNPILTHPIHASLTYDLSIANMFRANASGELLSKFGADLFRIRQGHELWSRPGRQDGA